jgi:hypothetical protein
MRDFETVTAMTWIGLFNDDKGLGGVVTQPVGLREILV